MYTCDTIPDGLMGAANAYKRKGETIGVSKPILYRNRKYYEIDYFKMSLFIFQKILSGLIIVDEQGNIVKDKDLVLDLSRMFHYCELIFDTSRKSYINTLVSDEQLKKENKDYMQYSETLKYLTSEGMTDTENIKYVLENLPRMREEANDAIKILIERTEKYGNNSSYLTDEMLHELVNMYDNIMIMGFQRVKLMNTASSSLNSIKRYLVKRKRNIKVRIDKKLQNNLLKFENVINFFINILLFYGDAIDNSEENYIGHMHEREKQKIIKKLNLLRNLN